MTKKERALDAAYKEYTAARALGDPAALAAARALARAAAEEVWDEYFADREAIEAEYGWVDLASDLGIPSAYDLLASRDIDTGNDLLRGTCIRLMGEAGLRFSGVDVADYQHDHPDSPTRWVWYYRDATETVGYRSDRKSNLLSEPAAYRDMLKHAGVLK